MPRAPRKLERSYPRKLEHSYPTSAGQRLRLLPSLDCLINQSRHAPAPLDPRARPDVGGPGQPRNGPYEGAVE